MKPKTNTFRELARESLVRRVEKIKNDITDLLIGRQPLTSENLAALEPIEWALMAVQEVVQVAAVEFSEDIVIDSRFKQILPPNPEDE